MMAVTNAGPLIALARIGQLSLLPALFEEVIMPAAVRDEVTAKGKAQVGADVVLMDEARGRRVAAARGLTLTGTLGTLILAKEQGLVDRVAPHLTDLKAEGFYLSDPLFEKVLRQAGEA